MDGKIPRTWSGKVDFQRWDLLDLLENSIYETTKSNRKFQGDLMRRGRTSCYLKKLIKLTAVGPSVFNEENKCTAVLDNAKLIISSTLLKVTFTRPSHHFATGANGKKKQHEANKRWLDSFTCCTG